MIIQTTITEWNSYDLAATIEIALHDGFAVQVNGHRVVGQYGQAPKVHVYSNGTIGFETLGKQPGKTRPIYVKVGERIVVEG